MAQLETRSPVQAPFWQREYEAAVLEDDPRKLSLYCTAPPKFSLRKLGRSGKRSIMLLRSCGYWISSKHAPNVRNMSLLPNLRCYGAGL